MNTRPQLGQAVIFDLDGTLVDTVEDIANAVNDTLADFGYPTHPIGFYKKSIGGGINDLIRRSLPKDHDVSTESYIKTLDHHYKTHLNQQTKVYPYVYEILDLLKEKEVPIAVISNKRHPFTVDSVNRFFPDSFDIIIGSGGDFPLKPDPQSALHVLEEYNAKPEKSFFVGDTEYDIMTAQNSEMISLGVMWGMSNKEKLSSFNADHLFDEPKHLFEFFQHI